MIGNKSGETYRCTQRKISKFNCGMEPFTHDLVLLYGIDCYPTMAVRCSNIRGFLRVLTMIFWVGLTTLKWPHVILLFSC